MSSEGNRDPSRTTPRATAATPLWPGTAAGAGPNPPGPSSSNPIDDSAWLISDSGDPDQDWQPEPDDAAWLIADAAAPEPDPAHEETAEGIDLSQPLPASGAVWPAPPRTALALDQITLPNFAPFATGLALSLTIVLLAVGAALNVNRFGINIAALGGQAGLLSIVGEDEAANELEKIVQSNGVQTFLERDETIDTTVKLRVLSRNQQLLRIDFEEKPSQDVLDRLNRRFRSLLPDYDAVILSDYRKGCLFQVADMIDFARDHNKPVLIDPKGDDYEKYAGASLITPNRNELRQVVGSWENEADLTEKAEALRRHLQLNAILLTRSEEGMSLYEPDHISHQPTRAQEVFDVSGAGDTVIATVGLGLAAKLDLRQAMHIANAAAGVVVAKLGTAVCSQAELLAALQQDVEAG